MGKRSCDVKGKITHSVKTRHGDMAHLLQEHVTLQLRQAYIGQQYTALFSH